MDIYEQKLVDLLNESEIENNTGINIQEISMPKTISSFDKEKFYDLISTANSVLIRNDKENKTQDTHTIVNIIMDAIKFALNLIGTAVSGAIANSITPDNLKFKFDFELKDKTKKIKINPIKFILIAIVNGLLDRLFEIAVAPARRSSMIKNYKKMVASLTELKNKAKDDETKADCEKIIKRINKEIDNLSNSKGDKEMKTIGEMLQEDGFEYEDNNYVEESSNSGELDDFMSMLENTIEELEEACKGKSCKTEGCGSNKEACGSKGCKKESDDMKDDIEPENESVIDIDIDDDFDTFM